MSYAILFPYTITVTLFLIFLVYIFADLTYLDHYNCSFLFGPANVNYIYSILRNFSLPPYFTTHQGAYQNCGTLHQVVTQVDAAVVRRCSVERYCSEMVSVE